MFFSAFNMALQNKTSSPGKQIAPGEPRQPMLSLQLCIFTPNSTCSDSHTPAVTETSRTTNRQGGHTESAATESKPLCSWDASDRTNLPGRRPLYPFSQRAVCSQPILRVLHVNTSTVGSVTWTADIRLVSDKHYLQGQKAPLCYCKESQLTIQLLKDGSQP